MNDRSAIVIVVDRLGCSHLGPYGNTWVATPELNRLASESLLFDFAMSDSPHLESVYRSLWQGLHAARSADLETASLADLLLETGVDIWLVTDEQQIAEHPLASSVSARFVAPAATGQAAANLEDTQLARLFAAVIEDITGAEAPGLVWVHAQGMAGLWDAPHSFRRRFVAEDDPDPPVFVEPPSRLLQRDYDPDELLGVSCAMAGQTMLLDVCLGALMQELAAMPQQRDTLLIVTSPRGFPLGEHLRVGECDNALYGELLHVPWLMRTAATQSDSVRSPALVQPADMFATLLDWFAIPRPEECDGKSLLPMPQNEDDFQRDRVCSISADQAAIRTPDWMLRSCGSQYELFVKPDDRWEANDVADRCPDVVTALAEALDEFKLAAQQGRLDQLPPLPDVLVEGMT